MILRRVMATVAACAAVAGLSILATGAAQATPAARPPTHLSWRQFYALPPAQLAAVQNPLLNNIVNPIGRAAASPAMARIYSAMALDVPHNAVDVYVTNLAQGRLLVAAAARRDRSLDPRQVVLRKTAYSAAALKAAALRVNAASAAGHLPFRLYAAADASLGASLQLRVPDPAPAARLAGVPLASLGGRSVRELAGVKLTFVHGSPIRRLSRENDSRPFIGGDFLWGWTGQKWTWCSGGIALESSTLEDYLVTANHCFQQQNNIYTQAFGHFVGHVSNFSFLTDTELIDTGKKAGYGTNADEGESNGCGGICWHPLVGTDWSWARGEDFCQDGITSFLNGYGVRCNMTATGAIVYPLVCSPNAPCGTVPEVETVSTNGDYVAFPGDSGAVVFTVGSGTNRFAAGMVSTGSCDQVGCLSMNFVTAPDIYDDLTYSNLGLKLNPHT